MKMLGNIILRQQVQNDGYRLKPILTSKLEQAFLLSNSSRVHMNFDHKKQLELISKIVELAHANLIFEFVQSYFKKD